MPPIPKAFTNSSTLRVETPCTYASWTTAASARSARLLGSRGARGSSRHLPYPRHLQLHGPNPRVPGALPVTVALSCASGTPLVTPCAYVLFYFHLHECLGEHPDALLEEVCVLIDHRLAQQLRESYPQFIGHRASSFGRLVSSEGTTRWPSSSTAFAFYTLTRTLPRIAFPVVSEWYQTAPIGALFSVTWVSMFLVEQTS